MNVINDPDNSKIAGVLVGDKIDLSNRCSKKKFEKFIFI